MGKEVHRELASAVVSTQGHSGDLKDKKPDLGRSSSRTAQEEAYLRDTIRPVRIKCNDWVGKKREKR